MLAHSPEVDQRVLCRRWWSADPHRCRDRQRS